MTIRNDATRIRIATKDERRQRAVVARQGQVLLDTDFNQQVRHQLERLEIETLDTLGAPGRLLVPAGNTGFRVTLSSEDAFQPIKIERGRGYLDGWLLENTEDCALASQPHPRVDDALGDPALIGVKALVRHIDPVEEPVLADVALGDAAASGRSLVDWQVLALPLDSDVEFSCAAAASHPKWLKLIEPSAGTLAVLESAATESTDPCKLTPGGGYSRLENLLYRFEVHDGEEAFSTVDGPRFQLDKLQLKLSRRNASVMVRIVAISADNESAEITVDPPSFDPRSWFAPGLYAEIVSVHDDVDPRAAFEKKKRWFGVASATDDRVVLEATADDITSSGATEDGAWFLRLWEPFPDQIATESHPGLATVSAPNDALESAEIDVGDGLKIKLGKGESTGTFRRGDYWTCAARADGSLNWPENEAMPPHGPEIRYAPLAVVAAVNPPPTPEDCRIPFATLSDPALLYRGGDGQSVSAPAGTEKELPSTLRVAVMRGKTPVPAAMVRWTFIEPAGASCLIDGQLCSAGDSYEAPTNENGLAEVRWAIDTTKEMQLKNHKVEAALIVETTTTLPPTVVFSATFETATHTGYTPGNCEHLSSVNNVQDALDTLCAELGNEKPETLTLRSLVLVDESERRVELVEKNRFILNGSAWKHNVFTSGIFFGLDGGRPEIGLEIGQPTSDPIVEVELDLPYPMTDSERLYWKAAKAPGLFGFQRLRLDGTVSVADKGPIDLPGLHWMHWSPSKAVAKFIELAPKHRWGQRHQNTSLAALKEALSRIPGLNNPLGHLPRLTTESFPERILCRIRLRSALFWAKGRQRKRIYLNAEYLGLSSKEVGLPAGPDRSTHVLVVDEVDPQRAADLDMFVYLKIPRE